MTVNINRCPSCQSSSPSVHMLPMLHNLSAESDVYYVECHECGYHGPDAATEEEARRLWRQESRHEYETGRCEFRIKRHEDGEK